jgi:hypothetical protein
MRCRRTIPPFKAYSRKRRQYTLTSLQSFQECLWKRPLEEEVIDHRAVTDKDEPDF